MEALGHLMGDSVEQMLEYYEEQLKTIDTDHYDSKEERDYTRELITDIIKDLKSKMI